MENGEWRENGGGGGRMEGRGAWCGARTHGRLRSLSLSSWRRFAWFASKSSFSFLFQHLRLLCKFAHNMCEFAT